MPKTPQSPLQMALAALESTVVPLERLGDFIGNEDKGGASGLGPFDRCAILLGVGDTIRDVQEAVKLEQREPAHIVLQQGGTSQEWFIHSHDCQSDAENDIKECAKGAYNTFGPFTLVTNPSEEDWYNLIEEIVAASHGPANVVEDADGE
jgi:hypothetical protein